MYNIQHPSLLRPPLAAVPWPSPRRPENETHFPPSWKLVATPPHPDVPQYWGYTGFLRDYKASYLKLLIASYVHDAYMSLKHLYYFEFGLK